MLVYERVKILIPSRFHPGQPTFDLGKHFAEDRRSANYPASEPPRMRGSNKFGPRTREAKPDRQNRPLGDRICCWGLRADVGGGQLIQHEDHEGFPRFTPRCGYNFFKAWISPNMGAICHSGERSQQVPVRREVALFLVQYVVICRWCLLMSHVLVTLLHFQLVYLEPVARIILSKWMSQTTRGPWWPP